MKPMSMQSPVALGRTKRGIEITRYTKSGKPQTERHFESALSRLWEDAYRIEQAEVRAEKAQDRESVRHLCIGAINIYATIAWNAYYAKDRVAVIEGLGFVEQYLHRLRTAGGVAEYDVRTARMLKNRLVKFAEMTGQEIPSIGVLPT